MANEVKAQILVDTTGAMKNIEQLTKESSDASASLTKIAKEINKWQTALLKSADGSKEQTIAIKNLEKYEKEYSNSLKRDIEVLKLFGASSSDITKKINEISKAQEVFAKSGNAKFVLELQSQAEELKDLQKELQAYANMVETAKQQRFEAAQAEADKREQLELEKEIAAQRQVQYDVAALLGDQQTILNMQLEDAKAKLTDAVTKFGAMSQEAREAAHAVQALQASMSTGPGSMNLLGGSNLLSIFANIVKFQLLLRPVTKAFNFVRDTINNSVKEAAEAEQIFSKLGTVFNGLEASAQNMANSLSDNLGIAKSTAASTLSTVGDLLQAQGMGIADSLEKAAEWAQQFADIIAFKDINMSLDEFAQNFMSGAAGNLRNFRTFGSIVKESAVQARLMAEGLDKLTGSELELAKMTARAEIALEQQKNSMGATEREWETMLSVNRRLSEAWTEYKENLGDTINQYLKPIKSWMISILDYANDVNRAMKEINSGEFTIKVEQVDSEKFFTEINELLLKSTKKTGTEGYLSMVNAGLTAQAAGPFSEATYAAQKDAYNALTSKAVADVMLATGASMDQMVKVAEKYDWDLTADIKRDAQAIVNTYITTQEKVSQMKKDMLSVAETTDSFTESLAALSHGNLLGTGLEEIYNKWNLLDENTEMTIEEMKALASDTEWYSNYIQALADNSIPLAIQNVIDTLTNMDLDQYADIFDLTFGTQDDEESYQAWLEEIRALYTILYNRQVQFGDVSDKTLKTVVNLWGKVNGEMEIYLKKMDTWKNIQSQIDSITSAESGAATTLSNYQLEQELISQMGEELGSNEFQRRLAQIETEALRTALVQSYMELGDLSQGQIDSVIKLVTSDNYNGGAVAVGGTQVLTADQAQALAQAIVSISNIGQSNDEYYDAVAAGIQKSLEDQMRINEEALYQFILANGLKIKGRTAEANKTEGLGIDSTTQSEIDSFWEQLKALTQAYIDSANAAGWNAHEDELWKNADIALEKFAKDVNEAALAAKQMQIWMDISNRAIGSLGATGDIINIFRGEGDIWSKLVNAVLTILENTESWGEIAEMLDRLYVIFEPVVAAIMDLIAALPWDDIIIFFKIVATALVVVTKIMEGITKLFNWIWENIKTAFYNLGVDIHNLFSFNDWERREYKDIAALLKDVSQTVTSGVERISDIWNTDVQIERNTRVGDDYAKQIAVVKNLYDAGVLTATEYRAQLNKISGGTPFDAIRSYGAGAYQAGNGGVNYYTGDRILNITIPNYTGDVSELAREIVRQEKLMNEPGGNTAA